MGCNRKERYSNQSKSRGGKTHLCKSYWKMQLSKETTALGKPRENDELFTNFDIMGRFSQCNNHKYGYRKEYHTY